MRIVHVLFLATLGLGADRAGAADERVNLRTYWCEGDQMRGAGLASHPFGEETRTGVMDPSRDWAKVVKLACIVDAPPRLQLRCRVLRGEDEQPQALPTLALQFGMPRSVPITGEDGRRLTATFLAHAFGTGGDFGPYACPFTLASTRGDAAPEVVSTIEIDHVDARAGAPRIRMMANGSLDLLYEVFPPSHVTESAQYAPYENFDRQLADYLGVAVSWEDRELFHVAAPRADTAERLQRFVRAFPDVPAD